MGMVPAKMDAARLLAAARVTQQGATWVVELEQAGGKVQRYECATESMALTMARMLERMSSWPGR